MKRGVGTAKAGGPSFCHYCNAQLQWKAGGGLHFVQLMSPGQPSYPVRVHHHCEKPALKEGYKK